MVLSGILSISYVIPTPKTSLIALMAFSHCSGTNITGFAPNALITNLAKTVDEIIPSVSASFQGRRINPVKINTFSPFLIFFTSPSAPLSDKGFPVYLIAPS